MAKTAPIEVKLLDLPEAKQYVRQLEDALLILWGELPREQTIELRRNCPPLMDFCAHLHHSIEHEQAMVRVNMWAQHYAELPEYEPTPTEAWADRLSKDTVRRWSKNNG